MFWKKDLTDREFAEKQLRIIAGVLRSLGGKNITTAFTICTGGIDIFQGFLNYMKKESPQQFQILEKEMEAYKKENPYEDTKDE